MGLVEDGDIDMAENLLYEDLNTDKEEIRDGVKRVMELYGYSGFADIFMM